MAQEAEDEPPGDPELGLAAAKRIDDPPVRDFDRHAALGVPLGVEHHLDVDDAVGCHPGQIRPGEVVEVLACEQYRHPRVVEVQELLEVVELVGGAGVLGRREGDHDAVAFGEFDHQFRLERTFDVHVELGFREFAGEGLECGDVDHVFPFPAPRAGRLHAIVAVMGRKEGRRFPDALRNIAVGRTLLGGRLPEAHRVRLGRLDALE